MNSIKACPVAKKCSGCQLQNMPYEEQLSWKQGKIVRLLGRFGKVLPIIGMEDPYHYRNKVQAAFTMTRNKRILSGVYQSATRSIVPVDTCLLEDRRADKIIVSIRKMLADFKCFPYDAHSGRGLLRHVLVRRGFVTGEIMVVLVMASPIFPTVKPFVRALLEKYPDITTIVQNINRDYDGLMLGEQNKVLYGKGYIEDVLCGLHFRISPRSFYQINPVQTEKLYNVAMEFAALSPEDRVIDAYCGIGTIGMIAARTAGQVLGVESNPDAVWDAKENARQNKLKNIQFIAADATDFLARMAEEGETADVLLMDPPRAGSMPRFLDAAAAMKPKRIVYISCNPETQARDLPRLLSQGYRVQKIQPVDLFPHTHHCEVCVELCRIEGQNRMN